MIDFIAGERHFIDHLWPVWRALPEERRGKLCVAHVSPNSERMHELLSYARRYDASWVKPFSSLRTMTTWLRSQDPRDPIVTCSVNDLRAGNMTGRPQIFMEHGAGQTYSNRHPSYAGGKNSREDVVLFLCPSEQVAAINREHYPQTPAVIVGCPKLDTWHLAKAKKPGKIPTVAISFHWTCSVAPEAGSALKHYLGVLGDLAACKKIHLVGHAHPRRLKEVRMLYRNAGIPLLESFADVVREADCYVVDNSSTLYEFASLDRPVVVLNAPWFRRDVEHGLRFWACADVGLQCDEPEQLLPTILAALADPPEVAARRREVVASVYGACDGQASARAVSAILAAADEYAASYSEKLVRFWSRMPKLRVAGNGRTYARFRDHYFETTDQRAIKVLRTLSGVRELPSEEIGNDELCNGS